MRWTLDNRIRHALSTMPVHFLAFELAQRVNNDGLGTKAVTVTGVVKKAHYEGWIECVGIVKNRGPNARCKIWRSLV